MRKLLWVSWVVILALALVLGGCSQPAQAPAPAPAPQAAPKPAAAPAPAPAPVAAPAGQPQKGGILKIIVANDIGTLGAPAEAVAGMYQRVAQPAMEYLVRFNAQRKIQSNLVQSYEIAPDGKFITLRLQKGVKFHDGTDFDAEAVKYNLENYAPNKVIPEALRIISSYEVVDKNTLKLNLKTFSSSLMCQLGDPPFALMASPTAMKKATTPDTMAADHMIGTGPFKFVSYQRGVNIKYARFDGYWQAGKPYLDGFEFVQIPDPVTALMAFKAGQAQVLFKVTPKDARDLEKEGYNIVTSETMPIYTIVPDGANADSPWSKKNVRLALEYAIDKKKLVASLGEGYFEPLIQMANSKDVNNNPTLTERAYNPEKAKQLLKEAGLENGFETTLYSQTGYSQDVLVAVQSYLKAVNIKGNIEFLDTSKFTALQNNGWKNGLMVNPIGMQPGDTANIARCFADTGVGQSWQKSVYRPPGWQDKINAIYAQIDETKRIAQQQELTKVMYDEVMAIPTWATPIISAQHKSVHDLKWSWGGLPHNYFAADAWLSK